MHGGSRLAARRRSAATTTTLTGLGNLCDSAGRPITSARDGTMRFMRLALLAMVVGALAACGTSGSAQGGATNSGGGGRIKIGLPF